MKLLFLSKENLSLARAEAESILGRGKLKNNLLFINTDKKTRRLSYTRMILNVLFEANNKNINEKIKKFDWKNAVKGSFALFFLDDFDKVSQSMSRKYGGMVYDRLKNPYVDLDKPETKIIAIKTDNKYYFGAEEWSNEEKFFERRP